MGEPVLLIGAGGFVGQALLAAMDASGIPVLAMGRGRVEGCGTSSHAMHPHLRDADDVLPLLRRVGTVVHLASTSTPGKSAGNPLQEMEGNLRPTLALLEALQRQPHVHLVYASSGGTLTHRQPGQTDEYEAVYSRSYHGAGKLAAEHFIEAWCHQFSARATVLRPSNLYGPGQQVRPGFGIIPAAMDKLVRGEVLQVWGDGSASRDYLYIDDFIRLLLATVEAPSTPGYRIFNGCSGESTSLNDLLDLIERVSGRRLLRSHAPGRSVDAPDVQLRAQRAHAAYGWAPGVPLAAGIERTWRWFIDSRR